MGFNGRKKNESTSQHGPSENIADQRGIQSPAWDSYVLGEGRVFAHLDGVAEEVYRGRKAALYHYIDSNLE